MLFNFHQLGEDVVLRLAGYLKQRPLPDFWQDFCQSCKNKRSRRQRKTEKLRIRVPPQVSDRQIVTFPHSTAAMAHESRSSTHFQWYRLRGLSHPYQLFTGLLCAGTQQLRHRPSPGP